MPTATPRSSGSRFSSLNNPDYRRLWLAGLWSFMSVQGQMLLRSLLAWDLTEREGALGFMYLVFGISMLVTTPLGGVAADRFPKRKVLLFAQSLIAGAALWMSIVVITGVVAFWMLLVASVAQGLAFSLLGPARVAMSAELVGKDQLGNAITLSMLSMNGTRVFAPSLAGVLAGVAFIGIGGTYALSTFVSLISLGQLYLLPRVPVSEGKRANPFSEIAAGVRYVFADGRLRRIVITSFFVIMFGFNYVAFIAALIEGIFELDDSWVGYASSAGAIGAVIASLQLAKFADGPGGMRIMIFSGISFGGFVMALGFDPSIWWAIVVFVIVGGASTTFQSMSNTLALTRTDDEMQGRVQSLMQLSFGGFGVAAFPLGMLAEAIGLRQAFVVMGTVATAGVVIFWLIELRARNRRTVVV